MNQIDKTAFSKPKIITSKNSELDKLWFQKLDQEIAEDYQINLSNVSLEIDNIIQSIDKTKWDVNKYNYNILENVYQDNKKDFFIISRRL